MSVYTLPTHRAQHHYPAYAPSDCVWCTREDYRRTQEIAAWEAAHDTQATAQADHDAHRGAVGEHRRAAVAEEGSNHTRQRKQAEQAAADDEGLDNQRESDSRREKRAVIARRP